MMSGPIPEGGGRRHYAGIGARTTPFEIQALMSQSAGVLSRRGFVLRSGGASGADCAFEEGVDAVGGEKAIYYADNPIPSWAFDTVDQFHPAPGHLGTRSRRLMARNAMQILGETGDDPVAFVLCWTPGGYRQGGTGQALRIAAFHEIPIFDLAIRSARQRVERFLETSCHPQKG